MKKLLATSYKHILITSALFAYIEMKSNLNGLSLSETPFIFHILVYIICGAVLNAVFEFAMKGMFKIEPQMEDVIGGGIGGFFAPIIAMLPVIAVEIYVLFNLFFVIGFAVYFIIIKLRKNENRSGF
jgi:hypothetical protein